MDMRKRIEALERTSGVWQLEDQIIYIGLSDDYDDLKIPHYAVNVQTGERKRLSVKTYSTLLRQEIDKGATRFQVTIE